MVNLWHELNRFKNKKIHTLHSLSVGFVFFVLLYVLTIIFKVSLCPVKALFGISCFGCGMTRGFISILNFDFKTAYEYNVLSIPLFTGIVLYCIFAVLDVLFDKNYIFCIEKQLSKKYMYAIYVAVLIVSTILNNTKL